MTPLPSAMLIHEGFGSGWLCATFGPPLLRFQRWTSVGSPPMDRIFQSMVLDPESGCDGVTDSYFRIMNLLHVRIPLSLVWSAVFCLYVRCEGLPVPAVYDHLLPAFYSARGDTSASCLSVSGYTCVHASMHVCSACCSASVVAKIVGSGLAVCMYVSMYTAYCGSVFVWAGPFRC